MRYGFRIELAYNDMEAEMVYDEDALSWLTLAGGYMDRFEDDKDIETVIGYFDSESRAGLDERVMKAFRDYGPADIRGLNIWELEEE